MSSKLGRVAGIDFGTVRVGIALSDAARQIASPHSVRQRQHAESDADFFRQFVRDEEVVLFVVGLPVHMSGDESQKSSEAREFGRWLNEVTGIEVTFFDERFTSREADTRMAAGQLSRKQRQTRRDMIAAQIIHATFLERGSNTAPEPLEE